MAIRTGFDLKLALSNAEDWDDMIGEVVTVWPSEDYPVPKQEEQEILDKLSEVNKEANKISQPYCLGTLDDPFYLKVTYPGCEFEYARIQRYSDYGCDEDTIQTWLKNAPVSGFGDNRVLETKVDPEVRRACEIPAEGFEVKKELLETIAKIWSSNFLPSKVRVEPYKIHIYGKGGHFKSHRDTPEKLLVGTFLLGLADTAVSVSYCDSDVLDSGQVGNFCIGNIKRTAKSGQWVAFHPDVPHSVEPLACGCRAAIAFKIFSLEDVDVLEEASRRYPSVIEQTRAVLKNIKGQYGIVLQHHYPMGTDADGLVGVDAVILSAAKQVRPDTVEVIPVVVAIYEQRVESYHEEDGLKSEVHACVYPFTRHHVDIYLGRSDENTEKSVAWIKDVKDLPFYSWDFKKKSMKWSSEEQEINHTGNESDGMRESSVYLAYAIVVL
ncbi:hypothetical protein E1B28_009347 [Marasmius oreades]|uniref:Prolyl 4-hydroxylase alpha subunit Fe(2+) 2OG dioxygenase domain-containing protein n=1 Tax=Marasmius oreades TaxID=181124 RepID=A0A9P7S072_9AGAR|nr:uncharacterized protein E1B28_009347 [Marasmius oreades]KAG7093054.1 hypothetical protein E1B28_009347 [Marasmius oreades]